MNIFKNTYLNFRDIISPVKPSKLLGNDFDSIDVCFGATDKTLSFWKRLFHPRIDIQSKIVDKVSKSRLNPKWLYEDGEME